MRDWLAAMLAGFVLDLILGDPEWLYHPVRLIGKLTAFLEKRLRARGGNLRMRAPILTSAVVLASALTAAALTALFSRLGRPGRLVAMAILDWMGLSVTSMAAEARGVLTALEEGLEAGRLRVARIVGRDTASLDEAGVIRATVESVAESCTDGVISPMFWGCVGGPAALWAMKAASTLDSMVGYRSERYRDIGWASARLDDLFNYLPARITAPLLCLGAWLTGLDGRNAWRVVARDHAKHDSPNSAWGEAAAAGALHLQLGGTHEYDSTPVPKPLIGDDDRPPIRADIRWAVRMFYAASFLGAILVAVAWILLRR